MATPKALLSQVSVGRFTLLALVVGLVAGLSALLAGHSPLAAFTAAELVAALILGAVAALHQWAKTGSTPGPLLSGGTILLLLLNAAVVVFPQAVATPQTQVGFAALALGFLVVFEEELMGLPLAIPGLRAGPAAPSKPAVPPSEPAPPIVEDPIPFASTATYTFGNVATTGSGGSGTATSVPDALDKLINEVGTPPKSP